MNTYYIGIDPGANGGFCVLCDGHVAELIKLPNCDYDVWNVINHYNALGTGVGSGPDKVVAVVEQQIPRPTAFFDKVTGTWRQSILKSTCLLYGNYSKILMATMAAGIPTEECPPKRWQEALKIPPKKKGETPTEWKNRLKAKATQLYPAQTVTLATADAILIATYLFRVRTGTLQSGEPCHA